MPPLVSDERVLVICSFVGVALGLFVGYVFPNTGTYIVKDFLAFSGGAGIAYVWARAGARDSSSRLRETSEQRVQSLCKRAVQRLGLTACQIRITANRLRAYSPADLTKSTLEDMATHLNSLAQHAQVSIGDLEEIPGMKIGFDDLVSEIQHVADELPPAAREAKEKLSEIQSRLQRLTPPLLSNPNIIQASRIACPVCHFGIGITVKTDDAAEIIRNCFGCDSRLFIDKTSLTIIRFEKGRPLSAIYTVEDGKAVFLCPRCGTRIRATPPPEGEELVKASCVRCTDLIHARPA